MKKLVLLAQLAVLVAAPALAEKPKVSKSPSESITKVESCRKRFTALCRAMQRCTTVPEDLGGPNCEAIDPGCDGLKGQAAYDTATVDSCVSGLEKLTCAQKLDPNDPAAADLETRVPSCKKLLDAETSAQADKEKASSNQTAAR